MNEALIILLAISVLATIKNRWELYAIAAIGFVLLAFGSIPEAQGIIELMFAFALAGRCIWCLIGTRKALQKS